MDADAMTIEEAFELHNYRLLGFCLTRTSHKEDAEDIAQTAWLKTLQSKQNVENYEAWLTTVAHNAIVDRFRKTQRKGREKGVNALPLEDTVETSWEPGYTMNLVDQVGARICLDIVRDAWKTLTEAQQTALGLQVLGYSDCEASSIMGKATTAIKQLRLRARVNLTKYLREKGGTRWR